MPSAFVPGFRPSLHGLPFANSWPDGMPVVTISTPFGRLPLGNARAGVCGGMVFATLDLFHYRLPPPAKPTPAVFRYLVRRLFASWDLPLGGLRYYFWQTRPGTSYLIGGARLRAGLTYLTVAEEWPKVKQVLDAGQLAPLGLVNVDSWNFRKVGQNHQVLAYGYEGDDASVTIFVYDPNYPARDDLTLRVLLTSPDENHPVIHSVEGPVTRGFFLTDYRKPSHPPVLDR